MGWSKQAPAVIHWSADGWRTAKDVPTRVTGLGAHLVDLETAALGQVSSVQFTFYWPASGRWEGADFSVKIP